MRSMVIPLSIGLRSSFRSQAELQIEIVARLKPTLAPMANFRRQTCLVQWFDAGPGCPLVDL